MKLDGQKSQLKTIIEEMEHFLIIMPTSGFIDHDDDEFCHIYLRIVGVKQ